MHKIKTIIVDDEARIRRGIERIVRSDGIEWEIIGTFSNGIEVLDYVKQRKPSIDLLITDVKMPEMDGLTLIKKVKELQLGPIFYSIIVSGYDDFPYLQTAIREKAFEYILKPIDRIEFSKLLRKVKLDIHKQMIQHYRLNELIKKEKKLNLTKQTQLLQEAIDSDTEDLSVMYWVDEFPSGYYQLLYICSDEFPYKLREYTQSDWNAISYAVENILDEVITNFLNLDLFQNGWWWRESGFNFWVLLQSQAKVELFCENILHFTNELKSAYSKYTPLTFSAARSEPFEDITVLSEWKKQLQSLIRLRMIYGGNQVFLKNVSKHQTPAQSSLTIELKESINKLCEMIGRSETEQIELKLKRFFKKITELESAYEIEYILRYFITHITKVLMDDGQTGLLHSEIVSLFDKISKETNINPLKNLVKEAVLKVHSRLKIYNLEHQQDPIEKAKNWIQEHLGEKITIRLLSDLVYMNPTYFSYYFKKHTGKTVLDFITDTRMETAKELLRNPKAKVNEISQLLGYQDSKHFSRLFKEKWGYSPSEYKKLYYN